MTDFSNRVNVRPVIVRVSGIVPQVVVAAQSGYVIRLTDYHIGNEQNYPISVTLFQESEKLFPSIPIGASGTVISDDIGVNGMELTRSSGIKATVSPDGNVAEIAIYYVLYDLREPLPKGTYRANAYNNIVVTRAPNRSGGQVEG